MLMAWCSERRSRKRSERPKQTRRVNYSGSRSGCWRVKERLMVKPKGCYLVTVNSMETRRRWLMATLTMTVNSTHLMMVTDSRLGRTKATNSGLLTGLQRGMNSESVIPTRWQTMTEKQMGSQTARG